jgi:hypothetical protein
VIVVFYWCFEIYLFLGVTAYDAEADPLINSCGLLLGLLSILRYVIMMIGLFTLRREASVVKTLRIVSAWCPFFWIIRAPVIRSNYAFYRMEDPSLFLFFFFAWYFYNLIRLSMWATTAIVLRNSRSYLRDFGQ